MVRSGSCRSLRVVVVRVGVIVVRNCRHGVASVVGGFARSSASSGALAAPGELQDHRVVNDAVDGGRRGHRVLEDPVPLAEHEVAGDHERPPLVALGHEGEEHLYLVSALLDVPDVVEDQELEGVEALQSARQREVTFGSEQLLDESERRREEHGVATLHQGVAEGASSVRLAPTREPEAEDVLSALEEVACRELVELCHDAAREPRPVEGFERLAGCEARGSKEPLGPSLSALVGLGLEDLEQRRQGSSYPRRVEPALLRPSGSAA